MKPMGEKKSRVHLLLRAWLMACRAIQLNTSSEDTARVTGLPQSGLVDKSPCGQSSYPACLRRSACSALERSLAQGSCFAVPGAGPPTLCSPVTAGSVAGSRAAGRHVWSELHGRDHPKECTSDLNPPSRAFVLLDRYKPGVQENGL